MKKTLSAGNESFRDMIENDRYYVDKTRFIQPLMESGSVVQLITRPRRFGKTLFMDTLREFLDVDVAAPGNTQRHRSLFAGRDILGEDAFCTQFMGQYPVLFLSLKDVKGLTFDSARSELANTLRECAEGFAYLLDSPRLTESDKTFLQNCRDWEYLLDPAHFEVAKKFLSRMTYLLAKHFERRVVLLIDEYDVPLQKSAKAGYYKEMLEFMQSFLSLLKSGSSLRINGLPVLRKTILTGCLRVSKASIFTDVNNFDVNTICMQGGPLATAIGFTENDVDELLNYYDLTSKKAQVKHWYDGYRFGSADMYCPWDVIRFCSDIQGDGVDFQNFHPENYWADTSSNDVIEDFLGFLSPADTDKMQTLVDGGTIELTVNEQLTYGDFRLHRADDFWTLLLFTGYLTVVQRVTGKRQTFLVRIPNEEIRETFETKIQAYFSSDNAQWANYGDALAKSFLAGDAENVRKTLLPLLRKYVSVRDAATKAPPENYYHGFLAAMMACAEGTIGNCQSNRETGDGFADLMFTSPDQDTGVVIEIKRCQTPQEMVPSAQAALEQIREKRYVDELLNFDCRRCWGFGIAFCRKACVVTVQALTVNS